MYFSLKTPLLVAVVGATLGLVGCGGDDNSSYNGGSHSNENNTTNSQVLKVSQFGEEYDPVTSQVIGLSRQDYTIGNNQFMITDKPIWGTIVDDKTPSYMVATNFFRKDLGNSDLESYAKNSVITHPTSDLYVWNYDTMGDNGQKIHQTMTLKPIDISGVFNFAQKSKQGFHLDMPVGISQFPTSVTFPQGTFCYAEYQNSTDRAVYSFDETDVTSYTSLQDFMIAKGISSTNGTISYVGANNELPLLTYTMAQGKKPSYAILYNGKVYENIFGQTQTYTANLDLTKGEVYCDFLEPKAADIIEQEVKKLQP